VGGIWCIVGGIWFDCGWDMVGISWCGCINLFIIALCGFNTFVNMWVCVCVDLSCGLCMWFLYCMDV
jgi:hypothetical protein